MRQTLPLALATLTGLAVFPVPASAQDAAPVDCGIWEAVEPGDTLATIARRCGVSEAQLADNNDHLDLTNLPMASVVTITPFESTPAPEEIEGPSDDPVLNAYRAEVRGKWRGTDGSCDALAGSWTFGDRAVRGNATVFDIEGVYGTTDRLVVETVRATDAEPFRLVVRQEGAGLAVTGPGIAVDLVACDG